MKKERKQSIRDFRLSEWPVLDVRSPVEFERGHIPGAIHFPLFTNEQRAEIGIHYKKEGRDAAVRLGFELVGPKLGEMLRIADEIAPNKKVRILCARGGMRSQSVAWLLKTSGIKVLVLEGGYKAYRNWVRETVESIPRINILGGLTGTGKTRILLALRELGEQVLDLEGLANHRGSSFGGLGMPTQPSTQHYENLIAEQIIQFDPNRPVWIESESGRVGNCWVPEALYKQMKASPTIEVVRPLTERLDLLTEMYGASDASDLIRATERIKENLGGERTRLAIEMIKKGDIREACRIILDYYDRNYRASLKRRPVSPLELDLSGMSDKKAARFLIANVSFDTYALSGAVQT